MRGFLVVFHQSSYRQARRQASGYKALVLIPDCGALEDMFVLVTEDGLECKSEDDKRWNGTLPQLSLLSKHPSGTRKFESYIASVFLSRAPPPEDSCDHRGDAGLLHVRGGGPLLTFGPSFEVP